MVVILIEHLCEFATAVIIKIPQTGWLKQQKLIFSSSGGQKSKVKVLADLVSPEPSFLGSQMVTFLLCPNMVIPPNLRAPVCPNLLCVQFSFSYKDSSQIRLGPTITASFNIISS